MRAPSSDAAGCSAGIFGRGTWDNIDQVLAAYRRSVGVVGAIEDGSRARRGRRGCRGGDVGGFGGRSCRGVFWHRLVGGGMDMVS